MQKTLPKSIKKSFEKSTYVLMDFSSILEGIWASKCHPNRIREATYCEVESQGGRTPQNPARPKSGQVIKLLKRPDMD